jgi:hypothetical protein
MHSPRDPKQPISHVNGDGFAAYRSPQWSLMPLHLHTATRTHKGKTRKVGKAPLDLNWTVRPYNTPDVIARCINENRNAGVRLKADQLVIDIDPRNGGTKGWEAFCFDFGIDPAQFPTVTTGSGGEHCYMSKPEGVPIMDTLKDYPGVEFKSRGRQVVAAGSIHPDTLKLYTWNPETPPLSKLPPVPPVLLKLITRPQRDSAVTGGGQATQIQIAERLALLNPKNFRDYNEWLKLGMACHHASNGDARSEFIEWSCLDPNYADDAERIGRHWDSFHANRKDGVSVQTLNLILRESGHHDAQIPLDSKGDDFDGEPIDGEASTEMDFEGPASEPPTRLSHVNAGNIDSQFALVNVGSKVRVLYWGKSTLDRTVRVPEFWTEEDFHRALRNKFITIESKKVDDEGNEKVEARRLPLSQWWLTRKNRYTYDGLIFDADAEEVSEADEINLWRGFAVAENPDGDWGLMKDHIRTVIAAGDPASFDYILRWIAYAFQNPTHQCEVAIVLLSEGRGTGKGFLGRALCDIFGGHALHIAKRKLLVGQFNSHFMQTAFLFCDEALWPGFKEDEGALQTLISEPMMMIEPKGVNAFMMPNALKVLMASNNKWVVPAAGDDRRYAVFEVSDARKQDHAYFGKIAAQLAAGGLGAMLHELRTWDLQGWHPRDNIPQTAALAAQKMLSVKPERRWLAGYLESGVLDCQHPSRANWVEAGAFYAQARRSVRALERWSDWEFSKVLDEWGVIQRRSNGSWRQFPPLHEMRTRWCEEMPWWPPFGDRVTAWSPAG